MLNAQQRPARPAGGLVLRLLLITAVAGLPLGCTSLSNLLDVEDPDIIEPGGLVGLQGAVALYAGALSEFAQAKDGSEASGPRLAQAIAWFTDEGRFGGTPPAVREMDLRNVTRENAAWDNTYLEIHRARTAAENAAQALIDVQGEGNDMRIGELFALSGAVHIMIGEAYCSGVPFSEFQPEEQFGSPLPTAEIFQRALERLDRADANVAGDADLVNLARVLRGRALLNLGQFAAAATAVSAVPTAFEYATQHSEADDRTKMWMYVDNYELDRLSISEDEGGNGLDYAIAGDPRLPTEQLAENGGLSRFDSETPMFRNSLWATTQRSSSIVLASGVEARLIEAEAALNASDIGGWTGMLDEARSFYGMGGVTDPGAADARVDLMFRERAFAMFFTGHRLGDLRRLIRQYGRGAETVFPTGAYHKDNLQRGTQVALPVPSTEDNNPNYDASACNPNQA